MSSIAVLGAGAWGRALAVQAQRAGAAVTLWARDPGRVPAPPGIALTATLPGAGHDALLVAIPTQFIRAALAPLRPSAPLIVCAKGVEAATQQLPGEILAGLHPGTHIAILTGPNFAHEVAAGLPAAAVLAATDPVLRARLIPLLASPAFRLYGNDDPLGAQLGGAAKNVIAIAAGAVIGAGLGENARAALITRGLAELGRLVTALGGRAATVAGLSGLGDLLLTCTGPTSRNFRCGLELGRGAPLAEAVAAAGGVVEGVATAPALVARAAGLELPICESVAALVQGRLTLQQAIAALLARPMRDE